MHQEDHRGLIDIMKKLLFIDDHVPRFDQSAGSRTSYNYLSLLIDMGLDISFIAADFLDDEPYSMPLRSIGVKVLTGRWFRAFWRLWLLFRSRQFDYVFFNRPGPTKLFIGYVTRFSEAKKLYQCHDLHFLRLRRKYLVDEDPRTFAQSYESERLEMDLIRKADVFLTFSQHEKDIISKRLPESRAEVIPLYFYEKFAPAISNFSQRHGLLCVGGFKHNPNIDAVLWFVKEVFPRIRERCPCVILHVVGNHPPEEIAALASEDIRILGFVSDEELSKLYQQVRLAVVPLRFGAGVKGKTMEAISCSLPLVSTAIGIEGVGLEDIVPATDDPQSFSERVVELYNNEMALRQCSTQLNEYATQNLTQKAAKVKMNQILSSLAQKKGG